MFRTYVTQAELALASYANLTTTRPDEAAMVDAGMSPTQAARFADDWWVVDQYNASSGLSVTVFERDGQTYLAILGTQPTDAGDIAAALDIAAGVDPIAIPQCIRTCAPRLSSGWRPASSRKASLLAAISEPNRHMVSVCRCGNNNMYGGSFRDGE